MASGSMNTPQQQRQRAMLQRVEADIGAMADNFRGMMRAAKVRRDEKWGEIAS